MVNSLSGKVCAISSQGIANWSELAVWLSQITILLLKRQYCLIKKPIQTSAVLHLERTTFHHVPKSFTMCKTGQKKDVQLTFRVIHCFLQRSEEGPSDTHSFPPPSLLWDHQAYALLLFIANHHIKLLTSYFLSWLFIPTGLSISGLAPNLLSTVIKTCPLCFVEITAPYPQILLPCYLHHLRIVCSQGSIMYLFPSFSHVWTRC